MKKFKRSFAFLLAMLLTFVFGMTAFAATIEISNSVQDQTYNAYKIFDVTKNGDAYAYTMASDSDWLGVVKNWADYDKNRGMTFTLTTSGNYSVTFDTTKYTENIAREFANYLNDNKDGKNYIGTVTGNGLETPVIIDKITGTENPLPAGYYFVTSSLGSVCILHTAADTAQISEKNEKPDITKTVRENLTDTTASVGEELPFTLTVNVGDNALTDYIVHDTMSSGLTLVQDSFTITVDGVAVPGSNYTITKPATDASTHVTTEGLTVGDSFDIKFLQSYLTTLATGTNIIIKYNAILNDNALIVDQEVNKVKLQYGATYSTEKKVTVETYGFGLVKTDSSNVILSDAHFRLYTDKDYTNEIKLILDGDTYRPIETKDIPADKTIDDVAVDIVAGNVKIDGLASGKYYLKETKAPDGYNPLSNSDADKEIASIEIGTEDNLVILDADGKYSEGGLRIENNKGGLIPSTGGMGTKIFYALGAVMILGAGIILVSKRRMNSVK